MFRFFHICHVGNSSTLKMILDYPTCKNMTLLHYSHIGDEYHVDCSSLAPAHLISVTTGSARVRYSGEVEIFQIECINYAYNLLFQRQTVLDV